MDLFSVIGSPYIGLVDEFCFTDCVALETISLPYALIVNKNAFEGCTSLTSIALFGMNTLGDFAFKNCSSLTQVNISSIFSACGSTINNDGVFLGCTLSGLSIYINTTIQTDLDIVDAQAGGANIII
jgi:hypothetical protein